MKRSGPGEGDLVRVRSEGELRPGTPIWIRPCNCGRNVATIVLGLDLDPALCTGHGYGICGHLIAPYVCPCTRKYHADPGARCLDKTIAEGRLYRLRDEATPQETIRHRHRERVE